MAGEEDRCAHQVKVREVHGLARSLAGVELRDAEKQIINNAGKRARLTSTPAAREALLCAARH